VSFNPVRFIEVPNPLFAVLKPMILLEAIVELLFIGLIRSTGIFVRWSFVAAWQLARGRQVVTFNKYYTRMADDKDPFNQMSDGIIHWLLGMGMWLGIIFLIV
jgi:hypothetical protein